MEQKQAVRKIKNPSSSSLSVSSVQQKEERSGPTFADLGINSILVNNIKNEFGFTSPTPVQMACIPQFLSFRDVAAEACTGSGKTLAYLIPVFEILLRKEGPESSTSRKSNQWGSIIISPTRELAYQILVVANKLRQGTNMNCILKTGGQIKLQKNQDKKEEKEKKDSNILIQGSKKNKDDDILDDVRHDVVIATPGRLKYILEKHLGQYKTGLVDLKELEVLILDEADVLLDMGFEKTLNEILGLLPKTRRTGLFSATQTRELQAMIRAGLRNPATISIKVLQSKPVDKLDNKSKGIEEEAIESQRTPLQLENFYLTCESDEKLTYLVQFIEKHREEKFIVFFSTCDCVDFFYGIIHDVLRKKGISLYALHGRMDPKKRLKTYETFVQNKESVLFSSDVAARGIDIPDIDWIIQFHPPQDPDFFVHRVGRTARAGRSGKSLVMLLPTEEAYVIFLQRRKVPLAQLPETMFHYDSNSETYGAQFIKKLEYEDRDILEKGTKAFISFIRSYKEHKCKFIFRLEEINMMKVIDGFGLLRLPKMSELRGSKVLEQFVPVPNEEVAKIAYKNKQREAQRQDKNKNIAEKKRLEQEEERKKAEAKKKFVSQGKYKIKEIKNPNNVGDEPKLRKRKKGLNQQIVEEWEELAKEEKLYRKLKKGKISRKEYDEVFTNME